jgi:coproporphyrinogen III oxidase
MHLSHQQTSKLWFEELKNKICASYEKIEEDYAKSFAIEPGKFVKKEWTRTEGGGGLSSIMKGNVFEKVGVNISSVHGEFSQGFRDKIPGASDNPNFFATGISLVAHMKSPLVPAVHFNTRYIETTKYWFGGGADLTPTFIDETETDKFHAAFKNCCDQHDANYYEKFKKECDDYFYLRHRNEPRGIGGIFFDYLDNNNFQQDFHFVQSVGNAIFSVYPEIVKDKMYLPWTEEQKEQQLIKRGRYVEFNLLYDRGTAFGLATGGNVEAILMSLPPEVKWP